MKKRLLLVMLAIVMVIGTMPITAVADETVVEVSTADELASALTNSENAGKTIKLTADVDGSSWTSVNTAANITLDGDGYKITGLAAPLFASIQIGGY